jgi:hypothetical protein
MTLDAVDDLLKRAARLTPDERLLVAQRLLEEVQNENRPPRKKTLIWSQLSGMLPYPAFGEDAQAYISRTRRDDTQRRDVV